MADEVQYWLEKMADELDDMERRGLFSRPEIDEVVRRRRDFEYRLRRPTPIKRDFLAYIDYETQLDDLRALRKRRLLRHSDADADDDQLRWRKSVSDFAGVRRILGIYRAASRRFKGDVQLWFRYLEFCRAKRNGRMKKVLAQAIRFHPNVLGLWIYAAAWEFDQNLNVEAARVHMQRALRAFPKSEDLWVEYLRMVLTYINKLKARKVALGEDKSTLVHAHENVNEEKWKDENQDLFMMLDEGKEVQNGLVNGEETENRTDTLSERASLLFQTIYDEATKALPTSMSLRKRFLDILADIDLVQSEKLNQKITDDIKINFRGDAEYWDWLARRQILSYKNNSDVAGNIALDLFNKASQVYEEALEVVASGKMFSFYAKFLLELLSSDNGSPSLCWSSKLTGAVDISSKLIYVYKKAKNKGVLDDELAHQYISLYVQIGQLDEAKKLADKLCNRHPFVPANLWALKASIEMKWALKESFPIKKENLQSVFDLLRTVLPKLNVAQADNLWLMAFKFFANRKDFFDNLLEILLAALVRSGRSEAEFSVPSALVSMVLVQDGVHKAREIYRRFLSLPSASAGLFRHCIELESNLALAGINDGLVNARKLYESALAFYKEDALLWKEYYLFELKAGSTEAANAVNWRARKILKETASIVCREKILV